MKSDRKKLRADKIDLLAHVKQLCSSLQDKEQEMRDFIRNFEHRIRDTESSNAKVISERERERWSLLKHAHDESERSLALAAQLNARDLQLQQIQDQLQEVNINSNICRTQYIFEIFFILGSSSIDRMHVGPREFIFMCSANTPIRITSTTIWSMLIKWL